MVNTMNARGLWGTVKNAHLHLIVVWVCPESLFSWYRWWFGKIWGRWWWGGGGGRGGGLGDPDPYDWHITLLVGRLVRVRLTPGFHYLLNPPDPPNPSLLHTSYLFVVIGFSVWCGPVFRIRTFLWYERPGKRYIRVKNYYIFNSVRICRRAK